MNVQGLGRVVFLHGIKTPRKNRRLHRLAGAFHREGFCVVIPYYGYIPALLSGLAGWIDGHLASTLAAFIKEDDILVGYSNGAAIAYLISEKIRIRGVILINPALDPDLVPKAGFVHVYHNKGDWVTGLAGLLPFHLWGSMGRDGYKGSLPHVTNYDCGKPPAGLPRLNGHTQIFKDGNLRPWSVFLAQRCVEEVISPIWK